MNVGDRCEVRLGDEWFSGTVRKLVPNLKLISVDFDLQGARAAVWEENVRPLQRTNAEEPQATLDFRKEPQQQKGKRHA